jgi:hypothetical protein
MGRHSRLSLSKFTQVQEKTGKQNSSCLVGQSADTPRSEGVRVTQRVVVHELKA